MEVIVKSLVFPDGVVNGRPAVFSKVLEEAITGIEYDGVDRKRTFKIKRFQVLPVEGGYLLIAQGKRK